MNSNRITYFIDIIFCVVILPALITLLPIDRWLEQRTLFVVLLVSWLYAIYFANRVFVIPSLFKGGKERLGAIAILTICLVITYMLAQFEGSPPSPQIARQLGAPGDIRREIAEQLGYVRERKPQTYHMQQQAVWFLYFLVTSFSVSMALLTQLYRHRSLNQDIIYEKKRAELALYKAQINPHFLFNTLNTLYGLIVAKSERAEEAFILFTNMMKYIYSYGSMDSVKLGDEVEYIDQYIELQRLRMNEQTKVEYSCSEEAKRSELMIAPMLLITFVENIFKHGVSAHTPTTLQILVSLEGKDLTLETRNPIVKRNDVGRCGQEEGGDKKEQERSGIGINNCRERLELLYPKLYELHIRQSSDDYHLTLKLKL